MIKVNVKTVSIISSGEIRYPISEDSVYTEVATGTLYADGEIITVSYTAQGESGTTHYTLTVQNNRAHLCSRGASEMALSFEKGLKYTTVYRVPPYAFDAKVESDEVTSTLTADGGDVRLCYKMNLGGDERHAKIVIRVTKAD